MASNTLNLAEDYANLVVRDLPVGMLAVLADASRMAVECDHVARAMQARAARAEEHPLHATIKNLYRQVAAVQRQVAQAAAEIPVMIGQLHREELERLRNPRTNEQMWDVAANREHL